MASKHLASVINKLTDSTEISPKTQKRVSLILMIIACIIASQTYSEEIEKHLFIIFPWTEHVSTTIKPTPISVLCALFLITPSYLRSNIKLTVYNIIQGTLNILFMSSFIGLIVGGEVWSIPFINISSQAILIFCILLSWIGMKSITGFIWIFLLILAIGRITDVDIAMGFWGVAFILCGSISLLCQLKGTNQNLLLALESDFYGYGKSIQTEVKEATNTAAKSTGVICKSMGN